MVFWSADDTAVSPPSYTTTAEEDVTLAFDATALLVAGDPPTVPQSVLYRVVDNGADEVIALADSPAPGASNTITQRIRGLVAGVTYKLHVSFVTGGNRRAMTLVVIVTE